MGDNKELIWVPTEFAKQYNGLESDAARYSVFENFLKDVTEQSRRDFKANLESLEEDVAIYTGLMLKVKQSFRAAKDEQLTASYALWDEYEKELPSVSKKVAGVVATLQPIHEALDDLSAKLNKLPLYQLGQVMDLLERFQKLDDSTKTMFKQIAGQTDKG